MTGPAFIGHADWQTTTIRAFQLLVNDNTTIASSKVYGPLATANMHSLGIHLDNVTTNGLTLFFQWFFDAALTIELTRDIIETRPGQLYDQTLTVRGPFLQITAFAEPAGPSSYTLDIYEATSDAISQRFSTDNVLITGFLVSIPAASTVSFRPIRVWCGPAVFFGWSSNAASWDIYLIYERPGGPSDNIIVVDNEVPIQSHPVYLPSTPVRIDCQNNDAAAKLFSFFLNAQPYHP